MMGRTFRTADTCRADGYASVLAIGMLTVLMALLSGGLALAKSSLLEARIYRDAFAARLLAEGGARAFGPLPPPAPDLAPQATIERLGPGRSYRRTTRRLTEEFGLIETEGVAGSDSSRARVGLLTWRLHPVTRLAAMGAGVVESARGLIGEAQVAGTTVKSPPTGWPTEVCAPHEVALVQLFPSGSIPIQHPAVSLRPDSLPGLGPLTGAALLDLAVPIRGPIAPEPVELGGACETGAYENWGSPSGPLSACGSYFPTLGSRASLSVVGGEGQGILVVDGDLDIAGGHRFVGILLIAGDLTVRDGALVDGFVRAGGSVSVASDASLHASGCGALFSLDHAERLVGTIWVPDYPWIAPL